MLNDVYVSHREGGMLNMFMFHVEWEGCDVKYVYVSRREEGV